MTKRNTIAIVGVLILAATVLAAAQSPSSIQIILRDSIDTNTAQEGDTFAGTLAHRLVVNGRVIGEEGDIVTGRVGKVVPSGRLKTPAEIHLSLVSVRRGRRRNPVEVGGLAIKAGSHKKRNLAMVAGGVAAGAIIGAITGGKKGAAIGGAVGAGAGTAGAYLTGKKEIVLPPETLLVFENESILIGTDELAGIQPPGAAASASSGNAGESQEEPVLRRRRRSHDDDDDDDEYEADQDYDDDDYDDDKYEGPVPEELEIEIEDGYAIVKVHWDDGEEKFRVRSHDYGRILVVVSRRTGLPRGWLRVNLGSEHHGKKFKFKHDRGDREHGKDRKKKKKKKKKDKD